MCWCPIQFLDSAKCFLSSANGFYNIPIALKHLKLLKKSFSELCGIYNNLNNEAEEYGLNQAQKNH